MSKNQSLSLAYALKKRSKKMAKGGDTGGAETSTTGNKTKTGGSNPGGASTGGAGTVTITTGKNPPQSINVSDVGGNTRARNAGGMDPSDENDDMMAKGGEMKSRRERMMDAALGRKMAKGGDVADPIKDSRLQSHAHEEDMVGDSGSSAIDGELDSGFQDHEGDKRRPSSAALSEADRDLNQHGEIEEGDQGGGEGFHDESYEGNPGDAHDQYQSDAHAMDMVGRIMKQRQQHFSKGGMVANQDTQITGMMPNEFDDLHLRDELDGSDMETGAAAGDNLGNAQEDKDRRDIVSRIMKSRAKKDKLPNPR